MSWLMRIMLSQPVKIIAAETASLIIDTVATAIALAILEKQKNKEENKDVQLYSTSKKNSPTNGKGSRLRLVSD